MRCRAVRLAAPALLLGLSCPALAAPPAAVDDTVVFHAGAWLGACDNLRACVAWGFADDDSAALMLRFPPDRSPVGGLLLRPEHALRTDGLHLQVGRRGAVLVLRATGLGTAQARARIDSARVRFLLPQLSQSGRVFLSGAQPGAQTRFSPLAAIRLAGASAVLDWVAHAQKHLPSPAAPLGASPPPSDLPSTAAAPSMVADLPAVRACARLDSGRPGQDRSGTVLSPRVVLWRIACGSGNFSQDSLFVLAEGDRAAPAVFEQPPHFPARPPGILANAEMDEAGLLSATEPSRGLEDCGDVRRYRWDGSRFRLVWAQLMPVCHGLAVEDWPVVYRAPPAGADNPPP